jgi:hypothetical protein
MRSVGSIRDPLVEVLMAANSLVDRQTWMLAQHRATANMLMPRTQTPHAI